MAEEEPILTDAPTPEAARHVSDYSRFVTLFKWGAIVSFAIAMFIVIFVL